MVFGGYILKARTSSGEWEEIGRYNRRIAWREVKQELGDLCEQYDAIRLDDGKGRAQWVKSCKRAEVKQIRQNVDLIRELSTLISTMSTLYKTQFDLIAAELNRIREELSKKPSPADILADALYYQEVLRRIGELYGGGKGESFLDFIKMILAMAGGAATIPIPEVSAPAPSPPPKPVTKVDIDKIFEEAGKIVDQVIKCPAAECVEGESSA